MLPQPLATVQHGFAVGAASAEVPSPSHNVQCWGLGSLAGPIIGGSLATPCVGGVLRGVHALCGEHGLLAQR